jgi:prophage antirepressor-like protein
MSDIQIFQNPQFGDIRTAGTPDKPMFCLADVCKALGLDSSQVIKRLDDGVVTIHPTKDSLGRTQKASFVNEDGLYDVILDSRKPEAKAFRKWVTSEVLPSIRKHGAYATATTIDNIIANPENGIKLLQALKDERDKRMLAESKVEKLEEVEKENAPKVVFADAIVGSKSSCLIGELAKYITQNGYKIGQNNLFEWLRAHHYLGTTGEYYNIPNQRYVEMGYFELKKNVHSENGVMKTTVTPKVTGKGMLYFINIFRKMANPLFEDKKILPEG